MSQARRIAGAASLHAYRGSVRIWGKLFSLTVSGGFAEFGTHSVLQPPIRLGGEARISIGSRVFVGRGSWLQALGDLDDVALEIGNGTRIVGNGTISAVSSVRLGEQVLVAGGVYIADHSHAFDGRTQPILAQGIAAAAPVEIGDGAWLGQNVVICPGVHVGRGAVIGANSVVKNDVPAFSLAVGAPARVVHGLSQTETPS